MVGIGLEEHARPRDRELEALAAHRLDQHAQLQLAAAGDFDRVLVVGLAHADGDIALGLAQQALADHARGAPCCLRGPASGLSLTEKVMARVGGSIGVGGSAVDHFGRADRVGDGGLGEAGDGDDVAGLGLLDRPALEAAEGQQLGEPRLLDHACRRG